MNNAIDNLKVVICHASESWIEFKQFTNFFRRHWAFKLLGWVFLLQVAAQRVLGECFGKALDLAGSLVLNLQKGIFADQHPYTKEMSQGNQKWTFLNGYPLHWCQQGTVFGFLQFCGEIALPIRTRFCPFVFLDAISLASLALTPLCRYIRPT